MSAQDKRVGAMRVRTLLRRDYGKGPHYIGDKWWHVSIRIERRELVDSGITPEEAHEKALRMLRVFDRCRPTEESTS